MKNDSYIEEIKKSFPQIELPLSEEQLKQIEAAAELKPQEKFVAKSNHVEEMEKELALAGELYNKTLALVKAWPRNGRWASFPRYINPYVCCKHLDSPSEAINSCIGEAEEKVEQYAERLSNAANKMLDMLDTAYEELAGALEAEKKGIKGEDRVEEHLSRNLSCRMLSSVVLPGVSVSEGAPKTAETDLLVFAPQGIYVCEIKNYGKAGQTLEVQSNGEILKRDHIGRVLDNMGSPFKQNLNHRRAVEKVLSDAGLGDVPVYTAVIVANTDVRLVNNSEYKAFDMYGFCDYVGQRPAMTSNVRLQSAYNAIQAKRMTERKFPILAVSPCYETLKNELICLEWGTGAKDIWLAGVTKSIQEWKDSVGEWWAATHKKAFRIDRMVQNMQTAAIAALCVWYIVAVLYAIWLGKAAWHDRTAGSFLIAGYVVTALVYVKSCLNTIGYSTRKSIVRNVLRMLVTQIVFSVLPAVLMLWYL